MSTMIETFAMARRCGVPLVSIGTADQAATIEAVVGAAAGLPVLTWDVMRGMVGRNDEGRAALAKAGVEADGTIAFTDALLAAPKLPHGSVLLALNAHRFLVSQEPSATAAAIQGIQNLRDQYKANYRMFAAVGPNVNLPPELAQDVMTLAHELPGPAALRTIIEEIYASARLEAPDDVVVGRAVEALAGLSAFAAEQASALALRDTGLDLDALWERKRQMIGQTPGLSVYRGRETFDDIIGHAALKAHLRRRITAAKRRPLGCVVFVDELDKAMANVEGDTTGVRMDQVRVLLQRMEDMEWLGLLLAGLAGAGKTLFAKALGNEAGVPMVGLDLGGMESKWVGESQGNLRTALSVIEAIGQGHAYFVGTSNNAAALRPELESRMTDGIWMFDVMSHAEREACWSYYERKYGLSKQARPDDDGWTGREVRNACRYAADTGCALTEAATVVVPITRSRATDVERLRRWAHGRLLDTGRPGTYRYEAEPMQAAVRAVTLPPSVVREIVDMKES